jgi:hypothetical protein
VPGDIAALHNHAAAARAMERNDVDAAIDLVSGRRFNNVDWREVKGGPSWSTIQHKSAALVIQAHDTGRQVDDEVLLKAYKIMADSYDLETAARYLELARPLVVKLSGMRSRPYVELALDNNLIMLSYFRAGGRLNLAGTNLRVRLSDITAERAGRRSSVPPAYDPELLIAFPARLPPEDRELFFELGRFPLLPRAQWHDQAALKRAFGDEAYLWWLDEWRSLDIYWRLSDAVTAQALSGAICHARGAGFKVIPPTSLPPEEVEPPGCLAP